QASAVALLLQRKSRAALSLLEQLAAGSNAGAEIWSDLAAARCDVARQESDAALLADCLAAADMALYLNHRSYEALFNRALAIEQLGIRDQAREAWEEYAKVEPDRRWGEEARRRAAALAPIVPFRKVLHAERDRLATDRAVAGALVRAQPQNARRWGETMVLGEWARARKQNDAETADVWLRVARNFGAELAAYRGEGMLAGAVAAIDNADPAELQSLTHAHLAFRDGQQALMQFRAAEAQVTLTRAARDFERGGSPLALVARYFVSHTFHALGNMAEAKRRDAPLLSAAPPEFPAHRAQLLWHLGLREQSDGEWGAAIEAFRESEAIFQRLGEVEAAATLSGLIAEVYDRTGDPAAAWKERIVLLRNLGRERTVRLRMSLDLAARAAILRKNWPVALSFLDLATGVTGELESPLVAVELRLLQARVYATIGRRDDAAQAIGLARAAAAWISDRAVATEVTADIMAAEAIETPVPERKIQLLTEAIDYHATRGRKIRLPDMYLSRGRAFRQIGDVPRAAADFEAGIAELERHRNSLPAGPRRWGIFDAAEELFDEAIATALKRRDGERAFAYAERARARELFDAIRTASTHVATRPPRTNDALIVSYVALPDRLAIFVREGSRLQTFEQLVERHTLAREAKAFRDAVEESSPAIRAAGETLYRRLIAPIAAHIRGREALVIVPGPVLEGLPFAALPAPSGGFLTEEHALVMAASAAVFDELAARPYAIGDRAEVLIVANPRTDGTLQPLPGSEREAAVIAALYGRAISLVGADATVDAFRREAPMANVIHIATHGVLPADATSHGALLFSGGRLDVLNIAALALPKTEVVVLAACSSADGSRRGEGTISVARAFLEAGASNVVATLWPVDDSGSARFFPLLHRYLER
ncbi:MAG TPA: CHAT domain-containing protein, partial [Thermoanaerobaculia bacterium]|nr:CHAT domain-containing protein [Thermoanaerobaculia bacterium]